MTQRLKSPTYKYELALMVTILVWGLNFPVVKAALQVMHPFAFNALRFTVSVSVLAALYFREFSHASIREIGGGRLWLRLAGLGLLGHFVYQLCFILGIDRTTSGNAALIMTSAPLFVALIGFAFGVEQLRKLAWAGLVVTLAGTIVIVVAGPQDVEFGRTSMIGNLLMVGAALSWGTYTAFSRPVLQIVKPGTLTFISMAVALPFLWIIGLPHILELEWSRITLWVWAAIIFSGGLSTGVAYLIWNLAVKNVGAAHTAAYGNVIPFIALFTGFLFLGEAITLLQILGGALIITGIVIMRRDRRRERMASPEMQ